MTGERGDPVVDLQRHRDAWRRHAYGRGPRPTDFLDGNMVEADRGPTAPELLAERDREHQAALAACAKAGEQWGEEILRANERAKTAEHDVRMYHDAWLRELGNKLIPKTHRIDALVLTTRQLVAEYEEHVVARAAAEGALAEAKAQAQNWKDCHDRAMAEVEAVKEWEAQIAALREVLADALSQLRKRSMVVTAVAEGVLTNTALAAARCVERAKVEGAEEMRERAAEIACPYCVRGTKVIRGGILPQHSVNDMMVPCAAAAIRALDAGALAARRG